MLSFLAKAPPEEPPPDEPPPDEPPVSPPVPEAPAVAELEPAVAAPPEEALITQISKS